MKNKRPNSVSKEANQNNYLIHLKSPVGFFFPLLFLIIMGVGGYYAVSMIPSSELTAIIKGDNIESKATIIAVIFTYLVFFSGIARMLLPNKLSFSQQPVFSYRNRVLRNIIAMIWLLSISIAILATYYNDMFPTGWQDGVVPTYWSEVKRHWGDYLLPGIVSLIFLLVTVYFIRNFFRIFNIALAHGEVKAFFNKPNYQPADAVTVRIQDKQSNNYRLKYRVHLSYVEEKGVVDNTKSNQTHNIKRFYLYNDYQDVSPTALSQGINFTLPESIEGVDNICTLKTKSKLHYWEIVVEEIENYFFAGFIFDVR